tara:strand:- start:109 stop:753 length:645 start_codon:yes stop_codon:yes gene_type:complete
MQYKFISIEGNIGVGKTTLANMLAKDLNARLILETFEKNPFLPKFYKNPEKNAFPLELFFMAERYYQLKQKKEQDLFQPFIISDYFFIKSKLFAHNNLQKDEIQLFNRLFDIMLSSLPKPDLLIYLHANIKKLQKNIQKRGRKFEQNITEKYLQNIQDRYLDYLKKQTDFPVLMINISNCDFKNEKTIYQKIKKLISYNYDIGIHHIELTKPMI